MENINYKVNRNDIYVGKVIKLSDLDSSHFHIHPNGIYTINEGLKLDLSEESRPQIYDKKPMIERNIILKKGDLLRRMFFVLDENNHANDLLYNSPHYPVQHISPVEDLQTSKIWIDEHAYRLDRILEYFDFPEIMTYEDVLKLQQYFANGYCLDNSTLFGLHKCNSDESDIISFDDRNIKCVHLKCQNDGVLPWQYYDALERCRNQVVEGKEVDFSIPSVKEGPVKVLKK